MPGPIGKAAAVEQRRIAELGVETLHVEGLVQEEALVVLKSGFMSMRLMQGLQQSFQKKDLF